MVIQLTDVLLQPPIHHIQACKHNLSVMDWGVYEEPLVCASPWVCEEVWEGFVENPDWIFCAVWDEEEGMECSEGAVYLGWCATGPKEV
jgi:hypothetical protein